MLCKQSYPFDIFYLIIQVWCLRFFMQAAPPPIKTSTIKFCIHHRKFVPQK